jgi:pyrroline-5-carboxylate reductase
MTIVGCGNMGNGLAQRLSTTHQLSFYDHHVEKTEKLEQQGYGKAFKDIKDALHQSELIILAVKPQNLKEAASLIHRELKETQTLVSLLAGTPIEILKTLFPNVNIVRMMPNLALIYGEGVIGLSSDEKMLEKNKEYLSNAFKSLGKIYWLPEHKIDALTALTGSGPAFFFMIVEAMIDAGIAMGFAAKDAQGLVHQMLQGSLTLLEKTDKHPGVLKWEIVSPGGTTIAGLKKLEEQAVRGHIINTFLAAYERAQQLSSSWKEEK